jgi:hypothetical protein
MFERFLPAAVEKVTQLAQAVTRDALHRAPATEFPQQIAGFKRIFDVMPLDEHRR